MFGIEIPTIVALITALGGLVMGFLAHRRGGKEIDAKSLDAHLTALREMYKEFVEDLRAEIDRLQEENRRLRQTVKELNEQLRELEKRERTLRTKLEEYERKLG